MAYASLITHVGTDARSRARLACAAELAGRLEARLIGVAAELYPMPVSAPEFGFVDVEMAAAVRERVDADFAEARALFEAAAPAAGAEAWRTGLGRPAEVVAREARAADLVVASSAHARDGDYETQAPPGDLIMTTGRPVLVAPADHRPLQGRAVVVAWKDTREARRATADALPFLLRADSVVVAAVFAGDERDRAAAQAQDVCRALARHGVAAHAHARPRAAGGVCESLFEVADEHDADLVVAGAYGHSRLREWIFGGVTRSLLADGGRYILMSH
jgi:nucleotide-binding universal stress UspA family protein